MKNNINSQTAKNGYKEEENICDDLKNIVIKNYFSSVLGNTYDNCLRINGNHKCDIKSNNNILKAQVKKIKEGQFQQLDRHWIDHLIKNIPELSNISQILKDLFEYPLLSNQKYIDKSKSLKKLCISNYSQETLTNFLEILNNNLKLILNYAFLGTNIELQPEYLFCVNYINNKRSNIILFKIKEIIDYLCKFDFKISTKKTAIILGNDAIISLQRKGGDCGRKTSNQFQIKIIVSKLIDKIENLNYKL